MVFSMKFMVSCDILYVFSMNFIIIIIIIIIDWFIYLFYSSWVFHSNVSWLPFTGIWVTANILFDASQ